MKSLNAWPSSDNSLCPIWSCSGRCPVKATLIKLLPPFSCGIYPNHTTFPSNLGYVPHDISQISLSYSEKGGVKHQCQAGGISSHPRVVQAKRHSNQCLSKQRWYFTVNHLQHSEHKEHEPRHRYHQADLRWNRHLAKRVFRQPDF